MIMTQEEKELLLKDLGARLQYKLHCRVFKLNEDIKENDDVLYGIIGNIVITLKSDKDECLMYYQIKPYLRPMSSMTEEEKKEISELLDAPIEIDSDGDITYLGGYSIIPCSDYQIYIDYLISHHFDFRGLIPMGLAIEAPEGMYKEK